MMLQLLQSGTVFLLLICLIQLQQLEANNDLDYKVVRLLRDHMHTIDPVSTSSVDNKRCPVCP